MLVLINKNIAKRFSKVTGIESIELKEYSKLDIPVSCHADMLLSVIEKTIFCYKDYYEENSDIFDRIKGYNVVKSLHKCSSKYPYDIGLNVLVIGKRIFCKKDFTASEILDYATDKDYKIIDVNQGYSCCSTLVIDENSAITSDKGIYNALKEEGVDALLVSTNRIKLEGYNCGFIGGSGCILDNKVYFFGDISKFDNFDEILAWLDNKKYKVFSIIQGDVSDFGGAKILI